MKKTYSVKQIAEMLGTSPETVRRWIRDGKMVADQTSRKAGNIVTAENLNRFIEATPKYAHMLTFSLLALAPPAGIGALAGMTTGMFFAHQAQKKEELRKNLEEMIAKLQENKMQKEAVKQQIQVEIEEIEERIELYKYMLNHDGALKKALDKVTKDLEE